MCTYKPLALLIAVLSLCVFTMAEDDADIVRHAAERSTLNQPGTTPFHLKATVAPSSERDAKSGLTGDVEIWWASPTQWRREVRSPVFSQISIVNGAREWQKSDGEYFPEWLREVAVQLIQPLPSLDRVLDGVGCADVKRLAGMVHFSWAEACANGKRTGSGSVAITERTGLLAYGGNMGGDGEFLDYQSFHGRMVARRLRVGDPEVTAKVTTLEELEEVSAALFDTEAESGNTQLLRTVVVDEALLRGNLLSVQPVAWPPVQDGPLEGVATAEIVIDRQGTLRELGSVVVTNPAVHDVAKNAITAMQFKPYLKQPYLENGIPVQVVSRIVLPFKTVRPSGVEAFASAQSYFERGRKLSCLGAGASAPYVLRAEFQAGIGTGRYEDTWISETEWKREAWFGASHLVRSQVGDKHYVLSEGEQSALLRLVMMIVEPIPAVDTMTESDWHIRRDTVDDVKTICVSRGPEDNSQGFWFDESGKLLKSTQGGLEIRRLLLLDYAGVHMARQIDVLKGGKLGLRFVVKDIVPAGSATPMSFELKGHEWQRAFTSEVR